jgi:uncharacterized protein DUF3987
LVKRTKKSNSTRGEMEPIGGGRVIVGGEPERHTDPKNPSIAIDRKRTIYAFLRRGGEWHDQVVTDAIRAALTVKLSGQWPTLGECVPPGSLLEHIRTVFEQETDIPTEIPVFATLHYLSALLLQKGVRIKFVGELVKPDIWSICLAESGAGKTYTQSKIAKAMAPNIRLFNDFASSAKFMEELRDNNEGLWLRDEFAQFLKTIENQPHMQEAKDYLLRCFDGTKIARNTKADQIVVDDPALTIFGSAVFSTFRNHVSEEMLLDGFAQRFAYIVAERDPNREPVGIYRVQQRVEEIKQKWQSIVGSDFEENYEVNEYGEKAFTEAFKILIVRADSSGVPGSYFRRIMHRGIKYALLYHILLGKKSAILDEEDFGYAARVCALNLRDLRRVLDQFHMSDIQRLADKAEAFIVRKKAEHQTVTPSKLLAGVRGFRDARHAREILAFLIETNPSLEGTIEMGRAQAAPATKKHLSVVK